MRQKIDLAYKNIIYEENDVLENGFDYFFNEYYEDEIFENSKNKKLKKRRRKKYKCDLSDKNNEELCVIYQNGSKEALEYLIIKNEALIYSRVEKYKNTYKQDLSDEDLFQEGAIGMITAAKRFDINLGYKFSTYATHWIDQSITRKIENEGFTIRLPVHIFENINKVRRELNEIEVLDINNEEKYKLLVKYTGFSLEEIHNLNRIYTNILNKTSLNIPVLNDGNSNGGETMELINFVKDDLKKDTFEKVSYGFLKEDIRKVLESLNERERDILLKRYGFIDEKEKTLEEIGVDYGLTRERIRQIESIALAKLRNPLRARKIIDYLYD